MSDASTKQMIALYNQQAAPTGFLSSFFQSPARNFHTSEEVEIDVTRGQEEVSVVIEDLSTGYRFNSTDIYTNKNFKPPIHKEAISLNAFDLIQRMPGQDPFQSPDFRSNLIERIFAGAVKIEAKIRRSIELQASQVLQLGVVTLIDENGNARYTIDYKPKATHLVTVGTAWNAGGATIADDIRAISEVIRNDGLADPNQLIMGVNAFEAFVQDADIIQRFETRRANLGAINPMRTDAEGGHFRGVVEIGNYSYDVWTYGGRFTHPQTGVATQFVTPASCIVRASSGRLDATFGAIPNIRALMGGGASSLLPELPGRITNAAGGMDLFTNAWMSDDGEQVFAGVGARPLMIPTAIDTFGNLATGT